MELRRYLRDVEKDPHRPQPVNSFVRPRLHHHSKTYLAIMVHGILSVAIYRSTGDSKRRWALYLHVQDAGMEEQYIFQAFGEEGELKLDIREGISPEDSTRLFEIIFVSEIDTQEDIDGVKDIMETQPMKNDIPSWNCQDWVMEKLHALNEECLLDEVSFQEAESTLENLIG